MKVKKFLLVLVAIVLSFSLFIPATTGFAGVSKMEIASIASKETGWEFSETDGIEWGETVQFKTTTLADATVATSTYFNEGIEFGVKIYSEFTSKVKITSFDQDSYLGFSWGLEDYTDKIGTNGGLQVYFKAGSTGKITVGTELVGNNATKKETPDVADIGEEFNFTVQITVDKKLKVFIGNVDATPELVQDYTNPFVGGVFAFGQKGKVTAEIFSLVIDYYGYSTCNAPNYTETFDATDPLHTDSKAGYNKKMFASYGKTSIFMPSFVEVKTNEQTGNSYLRIQNVNYSHIMTRYAYSNFEMTFDLFDMPNKVVLDQDGNVISYCAPHLMIYVGCQSIQSNSSSINPYLTTQYGWIAVGNNNNDYQNDLHLRQVATTVNSVKYFRDGAGRVLESAPCTDLSYQTLDGSQTKTPPNLLEVTESGVSKPMKVKVSLIDGVYKLYVIYASDYVNENSWDQVGATLMLNLGYTPKGFVGIGFSGSRTEPTNGNKYATLSGTASIDNLTIKNMDVGANIITNVPYLNNVEEGRTDTVYNYNDFYNDNDLLNNRLNSKGLDTTGIIIIVASALVVAGIAVATYFYLKRRAK